MPKLLTATPRAYLALTIIPTSPPTLPRDRSVLVVMGSAALIQLALFAAVTMCNPLYMTDYRQNKNPDAAHYVLLGRNAWLLGEYSRCASAPYTPDALRTPVYPLFVGALDIVGSARAIYAAQGLLHVLSVGLVYGLASSWAPRKAALATAAWMATDLMLAISTMEAMSETVFNFFVLAGMALLLQGTRDGAQAGMGRLGAAGALLAGAILTRPAGLYLPVALAIVWMAQALFSRRLARAVLEMGMFLAPVALAVGGWSARNFAAAGVPRLTTVDALGHVYFLGAGAYQVERGVSLVEAQRMIAEEFKLTPYDEAMNYWATGVAQADFDTQVRRAAPDVLARYPAALALSSATGIAKASISHNTGFLGELLGQRWQAPGMGGLARGSEDAWRRLASNGPWLVGVFGWQLVHLAAALGCGFVGVVAALRDRAHRLQVLLLLAGLAYFYLTVLMFGHDAFYRCRTPVLPFLYGFAGLGIVVLVARVKSLFVHDPNTCLTYTTPQ